MARTRSIKPDFWNHPLVIECSPEARLLFLGLWTHCDDGGRHPLTPKAIKGKVFPADPFTADQVEGWLKELVSSGLIKVYPAGDRTFLEISDWSSWCVVKNPTFQWPDASGEIPRRKRGGIKPEQSKVDETPKEPKADTTTPPQSPGSSKPPAKPRVPRRPTTPAEATPDALTAHQEQIAAYAEGKWKLEWGNPPGLGCALPEPVQAHMLEKFGAKEGLVIE